MDLSIVIVSFNTCELTCSCIGSIIEQTRGVAYEIIVVDNASEDGSADAIIARFPAVNLIRNDRNVGFSAGQNLGLTASKGEFVLILNSDAFFVGNAAKELIDFVRSASDRVGGAGPQIINADGSVAPSARRVRLTKAVIALGIVNRHFGVKRLLPSEAFLKRWLGVFLAPLHDNYAPHNKVLEADYVDGMCFLVRREVLEEVGLFDEQYFFDYEIIDLCNRIRAHNWKIFFFPGAQVVHLAHSSRRINPRIIVETHRSELVYYAKHAPQLVPFIQRVTSAVVRLRSFVSRFAHREQRQDVIVNDILTVCRTFDFRSVSSAQRIPRLKARASTYSAASETEARKQFEEESV